MSVLKSRGFLLGMGAGALLGAALIPAFALAQSADDATATPEAATLVPQAESAVCIDGPGLHFGFAGGPFGGLEDMAAALGVDVETLEAAIEAAQEATRPEAEARPALPRSDEEREAKRDAFIEALAAELGVSVEDVEAAIEAAQPTEEELEAARAERLAQLEERLDEAVADGRLTREEADRILATAESGERLFGDGFGRGFGGFGHRGGRFDFEFHGFGPDAEPEATTTPSSF